MLYKYTAMRMDGKRPQESQETYSAGRLAIDSQPPGLLIQLMARQRPVWRRSNPGKQTFTHSSPPAKSWLQVSATFRGIRRRHREWVLAESILGGTMAGRKLLVIALSSVLGWAHGSIAAESAGSDPAKPPEFAKAPDYSKRAHLLDASIRTRLLGRWSNPVDRVIIEITTIDLTSGALRGMEWAQTGPAAWNAHELVGWVNAAPAQENMDSVIPVTFSTTLYEYGTLPSWAGFLRDDQIITMHYLIWPNRRYSWDHVSAFQETWTRIP